MVADSSMAVRHSTGTLLATLETPTLVSRIRVLKHTLRVETLGWDDFWAPVHALAAPHIDDAVQQLRGAWRQYILSRFDPALRRDYCYRYFCLLDSVVRWSGRAGERDLYRRACRRSAGFECIAVTSGEARRPTLAAATTTLRNPSYLLSKLKHPRALDDSRYCPVITAPDDDSAGMFYNYRQYRLTVDSPLALMLYPAVRTPVRSASFAVIDALARRIGPGTDPRVVQRAKRLAQKLLLPLIAQHRPQHERFVLELVDVGAGTGALAATLCRHLSRDEQDSALSLRLWFVDICPTDPARFFATGDLRKAVDSLTYLGADYREWLARPEPLPAAPKLRIAILSKLFNNLSRFDLDSISTHVLRSPDTNQHLPHVCLAPGGRGPEGLMIASKPVELRIGRTYDQPSLADYYEALDAAFGAPDAAKEGHRPLPIRSFEPNCLASQNGEGILARLLQYCHYAIIEDADLRPGDLIEHARRLAAGSSTGLDLTRTLGMASNHVYLLARAGQPLPPLKGRRLW